MTRPGTSLPRRRHLAAAALLALLAMPAPAAEEGTHFGSWTYECEQEDPEADEECFISQNLVLRESGERVLRATVGYNEQDLLIGVITLPLGISLPPGAMLQVDDNEPVSILILSCTLAGCQAGYRFTDDIIASFKKGTSAKVTFYDLNRAPVTIPLSLKGFTAALRALKGG